MRTPALSPPPLAATRIEKVIGSFIASAAIAVAISLSKTVVIASLKHKWR